MVAVLALAGLGDLSAIPVAPIAAGWLLCKCLTVTGLIKRWRWIFVFFLILAAIHVMAFEVLGPVISFVNFLLMILVASTWRWFFLQETAPALSER